MNTLDDLRATLNEQADALHDPERYTRPIAVRARIRAVRRRRAGTVAVAAAVALLAAVTVTGSLRGPGSPEPADSVVGIDVPRTVDLLGSPYALRDSRDLDGAGSVTLDAADADRAVSLVATGLAEGSATLYDDDGEGDDGEGEAIARVRAGEPIAVPVPIGADPAQLRVQLDGAPGSARVGLAVYGATGELADGVDNGDVVFRSTIAGMRLITAAFADPGRSEVSLRFQGRLDRTGLATHCGSADDRLWLNVSVDGETFIRGSCGPAVGTDAAGSIYHPGTTGAGTHALEAYLTEGEDGARVTSTDATVGLAAYTEETPARHLHGADVDRTVEYAGRTWTLDRVVDADRASVDTASGDRLLAFLGGGDRTWTTWRGRLTRGASASIGGGDATSAGFLVSGVLLAGDRYDVRLRSEGADVSGALLVYRPV